MLAVAVDEKSRVSIVEIPRPAPGRYEALVRTELAALCNATDTEIIAKELPAVRRYPALLGHESVGTVECVGPGVRSYRPGDRVVGALLLTPTDPAYAAGFGGFCQYTLARDYPAMKAEGAIDEKPGDDVVFKIMRTVPRDIPVEAAVLLCTWREVLGSYADFRLREARRLLVFGGGPVGQSFVRFARLSGMQYVALVDPHEEKRALATRLGAGETFGRGDPRLASLSRAAGSPVDAVVDAAGREEIPSLAVPLIREGGRLCVYGLYRNGTVSLDTIAAPRNWSLLYHQWPIRESEYEAQEQLVSWIRSGSLDWQAFVTSRHPVRDVAKAVEDVRSRTAQKVLLEYPAE